MKETEEVVNKHVPTQEKHVEHQTDQHADHHVEKHENKNQPAEKNEPSSNQGRVVHIGMTIDEFVEECKSYAKSIDCTIPGETIPALYEKVEEMKENNITLNKENAEALIEEVADRAEKPKFFKKPKYDKEGCLMLLEEHFDF